MKYFSYLLIILFVVTGNSVIYAQSEPESDSYVFICPEAPKTIRVTSEVEIVTTFVWFKNGEEVFRGPSDSIVVFAPGLYTVLSINEAGCESDVSLPVTVYSRTLLAEDDFASTGTSIPVLIPIIYNDEEGCFALDSTGVTIISYANHGTVEILDDGQVVYTPFPGFSGIDTFTYTILDVKGNISNVARVIIDVTGDPLSTLLLSFNADAIDKKAQLDWTLTSIDDVLHFEVERSNDGSNFSNIATIVAGTTFDYQFTDQYTQPGYNYYRLKIIGKNNALIGISEIELLNFESSEELIIYPNPTYDFVNVESKTFMPSKIEIVNSNGQILFEAIPTSYRTQISLELLNPGIYFMKCYDKQSNVINIYKVQKL